MIFAGDCLNHPGLAVQLSIYLWNRGSCTSSIPTRSIHGSFLHQSQTEIQSGI